jgi:3,4-dihydroxy 2-butanone 4-phosphate synthase/GTP cyclohydrolase II
MAAAILKELGVKSVRLMTNNPEKIADLVSCGIPVLERIALVPTVFPENAAYLLTKVQRMQHLINLDEDRPNAKDIKDDDL